MKLIGNLYAYLWKGRDNNCNSYLFANCFKDGHHVIIDPGHLVTPVYKEPGLDRLIKEMEEDGLRVGDIGLVINSHLHLDHYEATPALIEKSKAQLAFHKIEEEYQKTVWKSTALAMGLNPPDINPDFYLKEGKLVFDGQRKLSLEVYHTPGHSPGHLSIYWSKKKVLISGDVVFYQGVGRTDLPGGSFQALKKSVERLSQLDIEYLLPGHNYNFPPGHLGFLQGREEITHNFSLIKRFYF
jgi:glyoxylase-like metal-dependent hydrolase (beta-lactamase superfamily II)